ncbi:MAG: nitroreductase family protein [Desulfobacterales bacterium]|nr:nitroreductase family protein [Desulfobacterales bacterium]
MELLEAIYTRRSIRKYQDQPVEEATVRTILGAAMMAPSAGNVQPWQFIVVDDREKLARVANVHPYVGMAVQAPLGILLCGDLRLEKYPGFWVQDCAAAMQNLLLAAHDQGLGAVWTGVYPVEERVQGFRDIFALPDPVIPLGLAVMGWPAKPGQRKDRFRPERIHRNRWQG